MTNVPRYLNRCPGSGTQPGHPDRSSARHRKRTVSRSAWKHYSGLWSRMNSQIGSEKSFRTVSTQN